MPKRSRSASICDGLRKTYFVQIGRGFLPLLAVMLLATPQLAFGQDNLAVTVNPRSLDLTEEAAGLTYTVVLDAAPSADVVITVVGETASVRVNDTVGDEDTLTFTAPDETAGTPGDWNTAQTVTVTAPEDANAVDETVTLTHTAKVGDKDAVTLRNASVRVTVDDIDDRGVTLSGSTLSFEEGAAAGGTYTVRLDTEPTAPVTVDIGGASGELTVSPSRLFFARDEHGLDNAKTVTVYAGEDFDAEPDSATLTHTVRGGDYTGVSAGTVAVTVTDPDTRGVRVSHTALGIAGGVSADYTVMLATQPTGNVSITVSESPESDDLRVSPTKLTFSRADWNRPKTVRVTVVGTPSTTGDVTLTHAVDASSSSRDTGYDDVTVGSVTVTVAEAQLGVRLSRSSLSVDEGATATYTVRLASNPGEATDATVTIVGGGTGTDLTVDPGSLTFSGPASDGTGATWNTAQTVTVTAAEDGDAVPDKVTLAHQIGGGNVRGGKLTVTVRENETRGVRVTPTTLEVTEGATGIYTVGLDSEPTGQVTVAVQGASGDVTVSPSQLTFTSTDWFSDKEVTVTAAADADGEPDADVTLRHVVRGADYDRVKADSVRVTIQEVDTRDMEVSDSALTIDEGGTNSYTVALTSQPTGTVTVVVRGQSGDVTVDPSRLIFTTGNWETAQTVEVKAGQDADAELDPVVTLTHAASGGGYDGVTGGMVSVTVTEDDDKGVRVTPSALTVTEGSVEESYTLVLNTEPTGTVTVTLGLGTTDTTATPPLSTAAAQSLVVTPTTLTFSRRDWNIPRRVTVSASEDDDGTGGTVVLTHSVRGGGYDSSGVMVQDVTVTVRDNDTPGLTVTPTSLEITLNSSRTYTVVLNTKPAGDVTVTTAGTGLNVSPTTLTFTSANWRNPQTVRVHAPQDASAGPVDVTNTVASPDDDNYGTDDNVTVAVIVKAATPGVAVNPTALKVTEGESASYTLVLTKKPTASVTVKISGAVGDVSVRPTSLSFSTAAGNWDRERTVTVSVRDDEDAVPDVAVTLTHTVTGAPEYESPATPFTISTVEVTPQENDKPGVIVSPMSLTVAAGVSGTYKVKLASEPTDAVTVVVERPSNKNVTVSGSPLVFTEDNWSRDQTVTVSVAKGTAADEKQSVTLEHTVTGGDYSGVEAPSVTVAIPLEGTPGAPTGLTATGGDQQVRLRWTAPTSDGGSPITRYEYRFQQGDGVFGSWRTISGGASATSYTVTGLENGTSYVFEIRAVNAIGSGQTTTANVTLGESAPGAPTGLTATGGDEQIQLSWNAPSTGGSQILRYEYRSRRSGGSWSDWETTSATSVTIENLTNGDRYDFEVRAVNSVGEGAAAATSGTPGTPPSAPTGLTPRAENEAIKVTWGMPADTGGSAVSRFEIRYRMSGGGWSNWLTVPGGSRATSYTFDDLTNGVAYDIQVRAVNGVGEGAAASVRATPMEGIDFAHFANGQAGGVTITSEIVLVNVETSTVTPAIYFYNQQGDMIDADSVVDVDGTEALAINGDGALTAPMGIAPRGEMTISTTGEGDLVIGSVRVFGTGRLGGVLRFDLPSVGVAGVGASEPVNDAIFPARRMERGINTGAAIRNLSSEPMTVTCMLMQGGKVVDTLTGVLPGDGHTSRFIDEMFPGADTTDFVGSVRCTAPDGGMFVGVALELDAPNGIFTTLPVVPLGTGSGNGESMLNFAHFANGDFGGTATSSDLVFVNVANSAVSPAIYFYDQMGNMIDASMVVDEMMDGVEVTEGVLMVTTEIASMGEMTISTSGMGDGIVGSVRVVSDGPIGGVLRFDIPSIGVAGVGASEAVNSAIFPARRMADGINTGAAIRNLESEMATVTCRLMAGGQRIGEATISLAGNGQNSRFINEMFATANTDDFEGSVHCTAPSGMMFTGVALEMDFNNRIFTTLPVVPVR